MEANTITSALDAVKFLMECIRRTDNSFYAELPFDYPENQDGSPVFSGEEVEDMTAMWPDVCRHLNAHTDKAINSAIMYLALDMGYTLRLEQYSVTDMHSARLFLSALVDVLGMGFHPDDPVTDYINLDTHEPTFDAGTAKLIEANLIDAHEVYDAAAADIYEETHAMAMSGAKCSE